MSKFHLSRTRLVEGVPMIKYITPMALLDAFCLGYGDLASDDAGRLTAT